MVEERHEQNSTNYSTSPQHAQHEIGSTANLFQSKAANESKKVQLLKDFAKPLQSYPLVESSKTRYKNDGLLYRKGIPTPFSGRLFERNSLGISTLEASFLDGQPHGQQVRRYPNGAISMEAVFDRGVLTGIKTRWWKNGQIREEEYWDGGNYRGKKSWDDNGRVIKEERVR
jgi:antitoxin component YwqK of YwqJK toxin-antitoxin module